MNNIAEKKRFESTLNFLNTYVSKSSSIIDVGVNNKLSEYLKNQGYNIENTKSKDLDFDSSELTTDIYEVATAFEILEHLLNPFSVLLNISAKKLVASIPLKLWFSNAYWDDKDPYSCHFHEFEQKQFEMLLKKTGWTIIASQKWKSYNPKAFGVRPLLRRFTYRYYIVYCERK